MLCTQKSRLQIQFAYAILWKTTYSAINIKKTQGDSGMFSLRTKFTLITVGLILVTVAITTVTAVISIKKIGTDTSNQILYLLCNSGEKIWIPALTA